ncbi:MAG: CTP synthase [Candidatus Paceibacterota bacterium]
MDSPRYIFVMGGVMSGIGKGTTTASLGKLLQSKGFKVTANKIDPYVNVDAGTMNPIEHGEVFVTKDGAETDQDMGNYERFLEEEPTTDNYITTGRVYKTVINKERNLEYDGKCVEVVPDIPNEAIRRIKKAASKTDADFVLTEVGGTIGEYQNVLFLEAARRMKMENPNLVLFILVSYLPIPETIGEMKTKPTQNAAKKLRSVGIQPDLILGRSKLPLDELRKKKISTFCNVDEEDIISAPDVDSVYKIPVNFAKEELGNKVLDKFDLKPKENHMKKWESLVEVIKKDKPTVSIGMVGKYFKTGDFTLTDSYISVIEAVKHASWAHEKEPSISWLSAEDIKQGSLENLNQYDGIIVPGGFGNRGIEGKIKAIQFCRENNIPWLGLCLGMQLGVVEFARNVCGLKDAHSSEFDKDASHPVIDVMESQEEKLKENRYGGTMRLGAYECKLKEGTVSASAYGERIVKERHRHRYELNNDYRDKLKEEGMKMAGVNPQRNLVEIIELPDHPFFVATQFHPEFKSRPLDPHPLFKKFIEASA